ncbi:hypothetical protein ACHAPI_009676 [Fusarium lateritium]
MSVDYRGVVTSFFSKRGEPITSALTLTLHGTDEEIPCFLEKNVPKVEDCEKLKSEADSDLDLSNYPGAGDAGVALVEFNISYLTSYVLSPPTTVFRIRPVTYAFQIQRTVAAKVLCSAPTHVAVGNFSGCINKRTRAIAARYNQGKAPDHVSRCRHRLVVRAYSPGDEVAAFRNLLEKPGLGDTAAKTGQVLIPSHWKLHLSLAYWVLVLLRSPAVPVMDIDDSKALHDLQQAVDKETDLSQLRQVASDEISWEEYSKTQDPNGTIQNLMSRVLNIADFLCTTPANAQRKPFSIWTNERAKGLSINEAGNTHRADLYGVWGNTLLPCFLIGDPRQLPPAMTTKDVDANNNLVNRFAEDGRVSPVAFFQGTGHPVYRLKTQLRMA